MIINMIAKRAKSEQFDVNSSDEKHSERVSDSDAKTWTTITANLAAQPTNKKYTNSSKWNVTVIGAILFLAV